MLNLKDIAVKVNRDVAEALARNLKAMPADKQTWKPLDNGRSALDQVQECALINFWVAEIYRTGSVPPFDGEMFEKGKAELDTVDKACATLAAGTDSLCEAILQLSDSDLEATVTLPWDSSPTTLAELFLVPYWNNAYHIGQISYIQTLYGDKEYH